MGWESDKGLAPGRVASLPLFRVVVTPGFTLGLLVNSMFMFVHLSACVLNFTIKEDNDEYLKIRDSGSAFFWETSSTKWPHSKQRGE